MFELNNLAKYTVNQIEGELKQVKRLRTKHWILVIIFVTLASVFTAMAIVSTCLYCFTYLNNLTKFIAIASGAVAVAFWILFFVYLPFNVKELKIIRTLEAYLKNKKKSK